MCMCTRTHAYTWYTHANTHTPHTNTPHTHIHTHTQHTWIHACRHTLRWSIATLLSPEVCLIRRWRSPCGLPFETFINKTFCLKQFDQCASFERTPQLSQTLFSFGTALLFRTKTAFSLRRWVANRRTLVRWWNIVNWRKECKNYVQMNWSS